jgi:hypothetical protein
MRRIRNVVAVVSLLAAWSAHAQYRQPDKLAPTLPAWIGGSDKGLYALFDHGMVSLPSSPNDTYTVVTVWSAVDDQVVWRKNLDGKAGSEEEGWAALEPEVRADLQGFGIRQPPGRVSLQKFPTGGDDPVTVEVVFRKGGYDLVAKAGRRGQKVIASGTIEQAQGGVVRVEGYVPVPGGTRVVVFVGVEDPNGPDGRESGFQMAGCNLKAGFKKP